MRQVRHHDRMNRPRDFSLGPDRPTTCSRERELAYLRDSIFLHRVSFGNLSKSLRHGLNLVADWWLGRWFPSLRPHRLRRVVWFWAHPAPAPLLWSREGRITLRGWLRDSDGRAPAAVLAHHGMATTVVPIRETLNDGHHFEQTVVVPAGFVWLRLDALLDSGITLPLGRRLVFRPPAWWKRILRRPDDASDHPASRLSLFVSSGVPSPQSIVLSDATEPAVSIVVPFYGQSEFTLRCLAAISRTATGIPCEIIAVDDCSPERKISVLGRIQGLRLHRNASNLGFVRSCNAGAALARGRYVVLLNNDTEVQPGWLEALLETFRVRPAAGLVGARLVYPDGTLQEAGGICWRDGSAWNYGRDGDPTRPEFNYLRETDYCSGACIMVPRDLWHELGGFDERYAPAYYEDTDLAFRVRAAGRNVYYQPKALVVHHEGKSNGTDTGAGVKAYQVRNQHIFFDRWKDVLAHHEPNGQRVFRARERSRSRKIILVIDHYVPRPDQDAGSRSMMTCLRFFAESGFSVKFIGDNHCAHQPYTDDLERLGIEVLVGDSFKESWPQWLAANGPEIDVVFLSRAHTAARWLDPLRRHTRAPLLFYGHDLLSRTLQRAYRDFGHEADLAASSEAARLEREVFAAVDWIYYPSVDEVDALRAEFPGYHVNRLPLYTFAQPERAVPGFSARSGLIFVGGFGHPPNADAITWFVRDAMPLLRGAIPGIHLTIVGSHPTAEIHALKSGDIILRSNVPEAELVALHRSHRLAIAPLRIGGGIKGKILEAMFLGTPVITTPIGAEGLRWTKHHLTTAAPADLAAAIVALYNNAEAWRELQENAWEFLAAEYSPASLHTALAPALATVQ